MTMTETFTREQLVSFGNYLLSEERRKLFVENPNFPNGQLLEERLSETHHADVENWLQKQTEVALN